MEGEMGAGGGGVEAVRLNVVTGVAPSSTFSVCVLVPGGGEANGTHGGAVAHPPDAAVVDLTQWSCSRAAASS